MPGEVTIYLSVTNKIKTKKKKKSSKGNEERIKMIERKE